MAKIDRKELLKALQVIKPSIPTNEDPDINKRVVIQGRVVIGFSEELIMICPIQKKLSAKPIVAPYDELVALLASSHSSEVDITVKDGKLTLLDGTVKVVLVVETENMLFEDLESIETLLGELPDELPEYTEELNGAIKLCAYSASKEAAQRVLSCVHVKDTTVEASDDFRISRCTLSKAFDGDVLIPAKACKHVIKFEPTGYYVTDTWILFEKDIGDENSAFVLSRQVDLNYNSVDEFLTVKGKKCTLPKQVARSISQVSVLATGEFDIEKSIKVEIAPGNVSIVAESDKGLAESIIESTEVSWKGKPVAFYTNPEFLAEILDKTNTMTVGSNSVLFKYDNFEHVLCISQKEDE